jgi:Cu2+-exporting ATPase
VTGPAAVRAVVAPVTAVDDATTGEDFSAYVRRGEDGQASLHLLVEGIHCGGCVAKIERALAALPGVTRARVNLTTRRLTVAWEEAAKDGPATSAADIAAALSDLGFRAVPYDPDALDADDRRQERELLRCLAVAGFAAANIMLLSISVWAGGTDMGAATRDLLHLISALIAIPAIAYAGRPFFRAAATALSAGRGAMEIPIALAVVLAAGMSLYESLTGGPHAYFDSAVTLLFFLLVGRYLDRRARGHARAAAARLLALGRAPVTVLGGDGVRVLRPADQVRPGDRVLVTAGERIGVDGRVVEGRSELDTSLVTGETLPAAAAPGERVFAGTLNLAAPLVLEVSAVGEETLLADIVRLMEAAEQRRARFVALADRVARLYAPVVHALALATFLGWLVFAAAPWQAALLYAVAVLIITCPCALGLAVPAVQVIASGRLLHRGILLKSGTALERFAAVDAVVFDKTGTLTVGRPALAGAYDAAALRDAAALAAASRHPLARALVRSAPEVAPAAGVRETPGHGLSLATAAGEVRLGSRAWCGVSDDGGEPGPELWLARPGRAPVRFGFADPLRPDAAQVVDALRRRGLGLVLLSGDRAATVAPLADALGIADWKAGCTPADKVDRLEALAAQGKRVLMVGDGLNDAPALASALVSLSPSSAADISQTAADAVFQGRILAPVLEVLVTARRADRLVRQNFALALAYNTVAIPLAVAGLVTPLVAAVAMSASSLVVIGNALRLGRRTAASAPDAARAAPAAAIAP